MEQVILNNIEIKKVRHLKNIDINIAEGKCKHVILTGKNGSGKTSLLDSMAAFIGSVTTGINPQEIISNIEYDKDAIQYYTERREYLQLKQRKKELDEQKKLLEKATAGVWLKFNKSFAVIRELFEKGQFVVAYYKAERVFSAIEPKHVEKIELKTGYSINENPRNEFVKYLLDLKVTQALSIANGNNDKAQKISEWFLKFEQLLKKIFDNESVRLEFDEEKFKFSIIMDGREPFDFNTLSSGYAAILDIVVDLIIRMEKQTKRTFDFNISGIVLIDEIETHLHLELQKNIMELLTTVFPNIQFVVSSHSPFILNSLNDVVIYDLENNVLVEHGLSDVPYSGIVEGYFNADQLSDELRAKFEEYKKLAQKPQFAEDDYERIADLEMYLNEIPDYLAINITTQYQELKAKIRAKEA